MVIVISFCIRPSTCGVANQAAKKTQQELINSQKEQKRHKKSESGNQMRSLAQADTNTNADMKLSVSKWGRETKRKEEVPLSHRHANNNKNSRQQTADSRQHYSPDSGRRSQGYRRPAWEWRWERATQRRSAAWSEFLSRWGRGRAK